MDEIDEFEQDLEPEVDDFGYNQLNELGNRAIALKLIAGHGYHQGKYELLHRGEAVLLSPKEAMAYLQALIQEAEQPDG